MPSLESPQDIFATAARRAGSKRTTGLLRSLIGVLVIALGGCAEDDVKLLGARELIMSDLDIIREVEPSSSLQLAQPQSCQQWQHINRNVSHHQSHCGTDQAWDLSSARLDINTTIHTPLSYNHMVFVSPVVADGIVYLQISSKRVEARSLENLEDRLWTYIFPDLSEYSDAEGGGLAFKDGRLYVTTGTRTMLALDIENGELLWKVQMPDIGKTAPIVTDGRIYVRGANGILSAYETEYGNRLWATLDREQFGIKLLSSSSPSYTKQSGLGYHLVIAGLPDGRVVALRPDSGVGVWEKSLRLNELSNALSIDDIATSPTIVNNQVIVGNLSQGTMALNLVRGEVIWQQPLFIRTTPWLADNTLFILDDRKVVSALRLNDGARYWSHSLSTEDEKVLWHGPILFNGHILVFSSAGIIRQIDPLTGKLTGERETTVKAASRPIIADDAILIPTTDGSLAVLR